MTNSIGSHNTLARAGAKASTTDSFKVKFHLPSGTFPDMVIGIVGYPIEDIPKELEEFGAPKPVVKQYIKETTEKELEDFPKHVAGFVWAHDSTILLWLGEWTGSQDNLDTLTHECMHLTQRVLMPRMMWEEQEAAAYQQEFFIKNLRHYLKQEYAKWRADGKRKRVVPKTRKRGAKNKPAHKVPKN